MSSVIECPQCRQGNELGRIFCTRCGTKLDMTRLTHGHMGGRFDLPGFLLGAVRVGIFLAMLVVLGLLLWPTPLAGQRGPEAEVTALLGQRQALVRAVEARQEVKLEASELALNAYLDATLKAGQRQEAVVGAWMMRLDAVNVAVQPGVVIVTTLAHWGPLAITWEVSGVPQVAERHFALVVKSGRIGHLGLPQVGADWMASRMAVLMNRWGADRELLDQLASVVAERQTLTLVTKLAKP